jgi:hypothetical protein
VISCPNCSHQYQMPRRYCGHCAHVMGQLCNNCGETNLIDDVYCGRCRQNLLSDQRTQPTTKETAPPQETPRGGSPAFEAIIAEAEEDRVVLERSSGEEMNDDDIKQLFGQE